jgi:hypothetical protein
MTCGEYMGVWNTEQKLTWTDPSPMRSSSIIQRLWLMFLEYCQTHFQNKLGSLFLWQHENTPINPKTWIHHKAFWKNQTHSSQVDRMWHTLRYLPPTNTGMRQHMVPNSQGVIGCIVQDEKKIKSLGCRPCLVTMDWFLTSILTSSDISII